MNRTLSLLVGLVSFWPIVSPVYATNPDLAYAPPPHLSQTAWHELEHTIAGHKTVLLHAQISAFGGLVPDVTITETQQWPLTSSEVQLWISQKWRFTPNFTGKTVQPVAFEVTRTPPQTSPTPGATERRSDLLLRSPKPIFPPGYFQSVRNYMLSNGMSTPGVLLVMTVREGTLTDIRVIDQCGPTRLCEYTVEWVRNNWRFRPGVTGTFKIPIYYQTAS